MIVTLLKTCRGDVVCVYADEAEAQAVRDGYNADPFIEPGNPDKDAPYATESWTVSEVGAQRAS